MPPTHASFRQHQPCPDRGPSITTYVSSRPRAQRARAERSVELGDSPLLPRTHRFLRSLASGFAFGYAVTSRSLGRNDM